MGCKVIKKFPLYVDCDGSQDSLKIISVTNISDGDNINHGLNGTVLIQFIDDLQVRGGFYAERVDANNSTFRTPVSGTFNGYLLCTKLF